MNKEKQAELIKEQLEQMSGLQYRYGGKIHTIKSYNINKESERVQVQTHLKNYERSFENCMEFLNNFEAIQETGMQMYDSKDAVPIPVMQINSDVIHSLKNVLMENIENVKKDKNYIPQATAVKLNVDSVIDLAKIEVAYMEAYVRMNKVK